MKAFLFLIRTLLLIFIYVTVRALGGSSFDMLILVLCIVLIQLCSYIEGRRGY